MSTKTYEYECCRCPKVCVMDAPVDGILYCSEECLAKDYPIKDYPEMFPAPVEPPPATATR